MHTLASKLDPKAKEAFINIGLMHKEAGKWKDALQAFTNSIKCAELTGVMFALPHDLMCQVYIQVGMHDMAYKSAITAITIAKGKFTSAATTANVPSAVNLLVTPRTTAPTAVDDLNLVQCQIRAGQCCVVKGDFRCALEFFDSVLKIDPGSWCWFYREFCIYIWSFLDVKLSLYSVDDIIDARVKKGGCKQLDWISVIRSAEELACPSKKYTPQRIPHAVRELDISHGKLAEYGSAWTDYVTNYHEKLKLLDIVYPYSSWIQLNCTGFPPSVRHYRAFGFSVLQMAAMLAKHWSALRVEGGVGLEVNDASSSSIAFHDAARSSSFHAAISAGSTATSASTGFRGSSNTHFFGWRDLLDVAVLWRRFADPIDSVWWIDRFEQKVYEEGLGLQTLMVNGQLRSPRYYIYCPQAIHRVRTIVLSEGYYTVADEKRTVSDENVRKLLQDPGCTLQVLHRVIGGDFYVRVPCPSISQPGLLTLEGTRITLCKREPDGFEFSIRTPGTPARSNQFDAELNTCFAELENYVVKSHSTAEGISDEILFQKAFEIFYLWIVYAPLSRGTAGCGYAVLISVLMSCGITLREPIPFGKQLDWEAILAHDCTEFIAKMKEWFTIVKSSVVSDALQESSDIFDARGSFRYVDTLRDVLEILGLPITQQESGMNSSTSKLVRKFEKGSFGKHIS
jgi:hypothetical protein